MIPRTFPSTYETANGDVRMVVYFITDLSGLERWVDYIPVKFAQLEDQKTNSYDNNGVHLVDPLSSTSGKQAWVDYIPVYADPDAEDAWYVSAQGYIPVGFSAAPTLSLDFTSSSETLDPRVTFSRGSLATRTNSSGVIEYAPHNLLTYSEQFDNAAWTKSNATITANSIVSPDGTTTADKLVEDSSTGAHTVQKNPAISGGHSFSVYAKADERTWLSLRFTGTTNSDAYFNLSTGSLGTATNCVAEIVNVGNGWYRCSVQVTVAASGDQAVIRLATANSTAGYTGDGTSGLYIWGAQLNVGALQPYYPTTVKNLLGYSEAFDNAAWTKSNSFIQTNLCLQSEDISTSWININSTEQTNTIISPAGTLTGDKLIEDTALGEHYVNSSSVSWVGNTQYTASIYLKAGERTRAQLQLGTGGNWVNGERTANFDLSAGTVVTSPGSPASASIISVGNGWYRCTLTATTVASPSGSGFLVKTIESGTTTSYTGNGTSGIYTWGAQLVQGSTPGDYQQTFSAALPVMYEAPNGTMTADKLVEDTANGVRYIAQVPAAFVLGTKYTLSFYAKAAERTTIDIRGANPATFAGRAVFDLVNGTVQSVVSGSASIEPVGNGWYRCVVFGTATASAATNIQLYLNAGVSYTGDGTSGIYIWGAQLSDSASVDPYVATPGAAPSAAAYYGPRFDYDPVTLAPKGLLIEEQRTNLLTYSSEFDNAAWTKANSSITANTIIAPDGTLTGDKLVENTSNAQHNIFQTATISDNTVATATVYVKAAERTFVRLNIRRKDAAGVGAYFNLSNGTIGTQVSGPSAVSITSVGNGWYRCSVTVDVLTGANTPALFCWTSTSDNVITYTGDGYSGIYIWGAQLEAGAFPTSYIPTTTAQVTRAADVATMTGTNFSSWHRQDEGTVYAEAVPVLSGTNVLCAINNGTNNEAINIYWNSNLVQFQVRDDATTQAAITGSRTVPFRVAGAYKANDFSAACNGTSLGTDLLGTVPTPDQMRLGNLTGGSFLNGTIKKIAYYPTRLSNVQLQALTS